MDLDCDLVGGIMKSDEEMGRDKPTVPAASNHIHYPKGKNSESKRMVDITRDKPIKVAVRVVVPVRDHPKFNFVGKLLGPKGNSLKRLQEDTMCKMAVLGRGSMKDRHKEEELRASGDPKFQHLSEELHVEISAFATPAEAHARIAYALAEVRRFLVPDYNDDIRQEQMWEMQVLSSQKNNNKDDDGTMGLQTQQNQSMETSTPGDDRLSGDGIEPGPQSPHDSTEHPALRGVANVDAPCPAGEPLIVGTSPANGNGDLSPTNGLTGTQGQAAAAAVASVLGGGRKRPLLAGGPRASMTPTKRTVMSLLARARAAQAKQLPPATFPRTTPERTPTLVPLLREDYITGAVNLNLI
ncbi:KH domain-containing, RNA-binding, signal transduction-associated protein 2 [Aethina tumida]|uniref:KH domain-containing, RNA-binding, signal transduction-associated protein 2 n=1 Tax=Aethina tumida TaxID=116153 RepID=UPI00096B2CD6|nr:KH domain-containing, RNA-binding, signal transduction-associated protein 2 [Aethina tumida]XP_049826520.1 KH domain-containing, RNA-binding, signal transduction-associated protein 2 [Aethina tumida]